MSRFKLQKKTQTQCLDLNCKKNLVKEMKLNGNKPKQTEPNII